MFLCVKKSRLTSNSDESNLVICWLRSALRPGTRTASVVCILMGPSSSAPSSSSSLAALLELAAADFFLRFLLFLPPLATATATTCGAASPLVKSLLLAPLAPGAMAALGWSSPAPPKCSSPEMVYLRAAYKTNATSRMSGGKNLCAFYG
jgi:hypothetical protein